MHARDIEPKLKELIKRASFLEPALAIRLEEVRRWIRDVSPGLLIQKKLLLSFLLELILDADFWLKLKSLTSEQKELLFRQMSVSDRYWYEVLFLKWFHERDRKFRIWKQKLKSGEFTQSDGTIIGELTRHIHHREGTVIHRYVADLSMATDAIVCSLTGQPLCVQITTMPEVHSHTKYQEWEKTLREWEIKRGIFVSYNPGKTEFIIELVNLILYNSQHLPEEHYLKFSF